jgi:hypothetical protein
VVCYKKRCLRSPLSLSLDVFFCGFSLSRSIPMRLKVDTSLKS